MTRPGSANGAEPGPTPIPEDTPTLPRGRRRTNTRGRQNTPSPAEHGGGRRPPGDGGATPPPPRDRGNSLWLTAAAAAALGYALFHAALARRAATDPALAADVPWLLTTAGIVAGVLALGSLWAAGARRASRRALAIIVVAGLAARLIVGAAPVLWETDHFRYLWDGAVTANGLDAYRFTPEQVQLGAEPVPPRLLELGQSAGPVLDGVNHPHLTTIYPPTAQAAFAAAYFVGPFDPGAWRAVLLAFDVAALLILLAMLRDLGRPLSWAALYWLNPLVLREAYGAAHLDVLSVPLVLAALWAAMRHRPASGAALLALAVGVKAWPIVLLPLVLGCSRRPRAAAGAALVFATGSLLLWAPVLRSGLGESSGFLAYAAGWQANDGAFRLLLVSLYRLAADWPAAVEAAPTVVRALVGAAVLVAVAWWSWRPPDDGREVVRRAGLIVATVFLLSPTQFPWYYLWLLPLLALRPRPSLLLYTALLPLYYLYADHMALLWLEHAPVWALLGIEWASARRQRRRDQLSIKETA